MSCVSGWDAGFRPTGRLWQGGYGPGWHWYGPDLITEFQGEWQVSPSSAIVAWVVGEFQEVGCVWPEAGTEMSQGGEYATEWGLEFVPAR